MSKDTPDPTTARSPEPTYAAPAATPPADEVAGGDVGDVVLVESVRPSLLARLGAEAVGTFLIVLAGLGALLYTTLSGAGALGSALGFGLALVGATIALGHVSGGHFNPAVTIGAAIAGRTPWRDVLPYWLAQVVGATLAAATLFLTIPEQLPTLVSQGVETSTRTFFGLTANGYGAHSPLSALSTGQVTFELLPALLIEILGSALLVAVVLGATGSRARRTLAPFAIGLTYAVLILVASPITNGGLNPARSTAAALFSESGLLGQVWLFWVAPIVGAALAGLAYRAFAATTIEDNLLEDDLLVDEEIEIDATRS